jgi:hypothetical protein
MLKILGILERDELPQDERFDRKTVLLAQQMFIDERGAHHQL